MRCAYWLALTATQAIFNAICNGTNITLLHDDRLVSHQAKTWRVGHAEIGVRHQLAFIEATFWINAIFVTAEIPQLCFGEVFQLSNTNAMLT